MGAAFLVAFDVIAILMMLPGLFPSPKKDEVVVRIGAGSAALPEVFQLEDGVEEKPHAGGDIPHVCVFNTRADTLGCTQGESNIGGTKFKDGEYVSRGISTKQVPEYLKITAYGRDALCISYITMSTYGGEDYLTWSGDLAKACDVAWYPSSARFPGADYHPNCVWISKDDRFLQGISLKMNDFRFPEGDNKTVTEGPGAQWHNNPDLICGSPGRQALWKKTDDEDNCIPYYPLHLQKDEHGSDKDEDVVINRWSTRCETKGTYHALPARDRNSVNGNKGDTSVKEANWVDPRKLLRRSTKQRRESLMEQGDKCVDELVISKIEQQSAKELCESATSWGGDFVSEREGLYCDMCDHQLWELCSKDVKEYCFDLETKTLILSRAGQHIVSRDEVEMQKTYKSVSHWK